MRTDSLICLPSHHVSVLINLEILVIWRQGNKTWEIHTLAKNWHKRMAKSRAPEITQSVLMVTRYPVYSFYVRFVDWCLSLCYLLIVFLCIIPHRFFFKFCLEAVVCWENHRTWVGKLATPVTSNYIRPHLLATRWYELMT